MSSSDLAFRAAWFHTPRPTRSITRRAATDREAWLAYTAWHATAPNPAGASVAECRAEIAAAQAGGGS